MTWGMDYNGGPYHEGRCPECNRSTFTTYDELCDECEELANIPDDLEEPTDEEAEIFTNRVLKLLK